MQNDANIEFFTEEQIKEKRRKSRMSFRVPMMIFLLALIVLISFSGISFMGVSKCRQESKRQSVYIPNLDNNAGIVKDSNSSSMQTYFSDQCIRNSFFAKNLENFLSVTISFISVLLITIIYLSLFEKYELSMSFGKSVIIAFILSAASLFAIIFGLFGTILASILGIWTVFKVLGTDFWGALIFIAIIRFLNFLFVMLIGKVLLIIFS